MKDIDFSVQDIKDLMASMHKHNIGGLRIEQGSFHLEIDGARLEAVSAAPLPRSATASSPAEDEEPQFDGNIVRSPIVGTFYAAPSPEKPPFVKPGDSVKKGDVLFIIESMKLMNEVTSDYDGTVSEVLVKNGQPVEYGEPILTIE